MTRRVPNVRLAALLKESGWTGEQLARAVNALGAENGMNLHYDRTSVAHWLRGAVPRRPVPDLIAEAFSRRLGHRVPPPEESSLPAVGTFGAGKPDFAGAADAVDRLAELHAGRRHLRRGGAYLLAGTNVPQWVQASAVPVPHRHLEPGRVERADTDSVRMMRQVFSDADAAFGGGRAVDALAAYLARDVAPRLRIQAAPRIRRRLFEAATELTYLCAFMYFDLEKHAAAQRYYEVALDLAAENQDPAAFATTLRAMSVQAHTLGHHGRAADFAEASLSVAPRLVPAGTRAFLYGQAAVAAAAVGGKQNALAALHRAEVLLEHGEDSSGVAVGAYHEASLAHQRAAVLSALGDSDGAAKALAASIRMRPSTERRARAVTLGALAQLQLRQGQLEQAVATSQKFLDDFVYLDSGRVDSALASIRASLRPYLRSPAVASLWDRAARVALPHSGSGRPGR